MVSQQFTRGLSQANPLLLIYPRGIHPSQEFLQFCVWFSTAFSRTPEISCDMQFTRVFGQKRWFPLLRRMKVVKLHRWTEFACVDALSTWVGPTGVRGPPGGSRAHGHSQPFWAHPWPVLARSGSVFTVRLPSSDLVVSTRVLWPQVALPRPVCGPFSVDLPHSLRASAFYRLARFHHTFPRLPPHVSAGAFAIVTGSRCGRTHVLAPLGSLT